MNFIKKIAANKTYTQCPFNFAKATLNIDGTLRIAKPL